MSALLILIASVALAIAVSLWIRSHDRRIIHDQRVHLRRARHENRIMEIIARNASDGLVLQDVYGHIEWSNPAYSRLTGYSAEEMRGRKPQEFILPPENQLTPAELEAFKYDTSSGILDKLEIVRNVRKNGEYFWNELGFAVVNYDEQAEPKVIVIARDVTKQIEREEALERAKSDLQWRAETDMLTGLANRMKLDSFLCEALEAAGGDAGEVGIIHIDLDRFKQVNDNLGHAVGDAVLAHTAAILQHHVRSGDVVSRFGGDEFIIVCPNIKEISELGRIAQLCLADLKRPLFRADRRISVGASIGIALSDPTARNPQELMRRADIALYEVKNSGRNGVMVFSPQLGEQVTKRTEISSALTTAIANDQMDIVLQPQFDMHLCQVTGFEALIRWNHPTRGVLPPAAFFDIAECDGVMEEIDMIAMSKALDALQALRTATGRKLRMSINVSARSLNQHRYIDALKWNVEKRGFEPADVAVEVLETILIQGDENQAAKSISVLSEAGFAVELDDFGTGYSGLANLAQLRIQGVKIDRALVRNLTSDVTAQTVVRAIFNLCRDLGLSVVSEGVEEPAQAERIQSLGGVIVQGYGIARPMSLEKAIQWMRATDMQTILAPDHSFAQPLLAAQIRAG